VAPDLTTGEKRQLTKLKPGYSVRGFDISPDGKEILYDRAQENSERRATDGELKSAAHKRFRR
jgi:hypothetical protein